MDRSYVYTNDVTDEIVDQWVWAVALRYVSPISGEVIGLDCQEFSPGNAYYELVDESRREELRARDSWLKGHQYPWDWDRIGYTYYRIYGEQRIIAEGLVRLWLPQKMRLPGSEE